MTKTELVRTIAGMTRYDVDSSDDKIEDAFATFNRIIAEARDIVEREKKPKREKGSIQTTNPYGHPFPHAKLRNVTLTSIERLSKNVNYSHHLTK